MSIEKESVLSDKFDTIKPIFSMESNYCLTEKYTHFSIKVIKASVQLILFSRKIIFIPKSNFGLFILNNISNIIGVHDKGNNSFVYYFNSEPSPKEYIDNLCKILVAFAAEDPFRLYGFFTYEFINLKIKYNLKNTLIGVFYLPEIILEDREKISHFSAKVPKNKKIILKLEEESKIIKGDLNINSFIKGNNKNYEDIYKVSIESITNNKITSLNPSFSISRKTEKSPFLLHEELKSKNPAPYNIYMEFFGLSLIGSSPAMFIRCKANLVETSPICGTVTRGKSEEEDNFRIKELLNSKKDDFELTECINSDIEAKKYCCDNTLIINNKEIEKFSNVIHTSAHIAGCLKKGKTIGDLIQAHMWPSTIVGSPSDLAVQIIAENEIRHWYGGIYGYISANGNIDFCSIIRSAIVNNGVVTTRVGSTITKYSTQKLEINELYAKAGLILDSI